MTQPRAGVVLEAAELGLPDGHDTLALGPLERHEFDHIAHEHPPDDGDDPFDLHAMGPELLAACSAAPKLTVPQATALLDEWTHGDAQAVLAQCIALCLPTAVDRAWWRLERDPRLRAEMDYCGPAGIPHSTFLGAGIGLWDEHDRELALAWDLRRKATCRCNTRRDQWKDDPQAFDVDAFDCPGCYALSRAAKQLKEGQSEHVHLFLTPASGDDDERPVDDDLDDDEAG
jgi:hypothetical protein